MAEEVSFNPEEMEDKIKKWKEDNKPDLQYFSEPYTQQEEELIAQLRSKNYTYPQIVKAVKEILGINRTYHALRAKGLQLERKANILESS